MRLLASVAVVATLLLAHPSAQTAETAAPPRAAATEVAVNLNTASAAELEKLPGIGPKVAGRIVEYRQKKGPFKKIEELMNVQGIGEKSFLKLRSRITVGAATDVASKQQ